ncbi:MAG: hypothetical protein ACXIT4_05155 [Erythrobacter sp.]
MINIPFVDRIWRVEDSLVLDEPLSAEETFKRLEPLLQSPGAQYSVEGNTLSYVKKNPTAQDKLATFTNGSIRYEMQPGGPSLAYDVKSTALFLCFLAPLLFLGFAQLMVVVNQWENSKVEAIVEEAEKPEEEAKKKIELHPIDVMLGAPAPDDPDAKKEEAVDEEGEPKEKFSPTRAYVLAGLFVLIYLVGRFLEPWLLKRTFRRALANPIGEAQAPAGTQAHSVTGMPPKVSQ